METLKISQINKTTVFNCPFEGNNCLVKTGSSEGIFTSFLNSVLNACSKDFKYLDKNEKHERINRVRDSLFAKINKNMWKIEGIKHYKNILFQNIKEYYDFINTTNKITNSTVKKIGKKLIQNRKQFELFKIIVELLPYNEITNFKSDTNSIDEYKDEIIQHVIMYLQNLEILNEFSEENIDYILKNISEFIKTILNESEYESFNNYKYNVTDIDKIFINAVSDYFACNIYFLSAETRLPYILTDYNKMKNINSIILLSFINKHFEIVGILSHKNTVNRILLYDNPIIKIINKIINKPNLPLVYDIEESIPEKEESIPEKEESIPEKEENIPEKEESIPEKEENIQNIPEKEYIPKKIEIKRYLDDSSNDEYSSSDSEILSNDED